MMLMMEKVGSRARAWMTDTWSSATGGSMNNAEIEATSSGFANCGRSLSIKHMSPTSRSVVLISMACFALVTLSYLAFSTSAPANSLIWSLIDKVQKQYDDPSYVASILEAAADDNRTVIMTTMNAAWTKDGSMLGMFLEGIKSGDGTASLLRHVIVVCFDRVAYHHCVHLASFESPSFHCLRLQTPGVDFSGEELYLTHDYILMMWRRIQFLASVLHMGMNFIFTDADVLWFRNPFPKLLNDNESDFQMACDSYNGNPWDINNHPNAGFIFVRANNRTVDFYNYWYNERNRDPKMADQEVFNVIKHEDNFKKIGMKIRFLDTQFFGGFCAIKTSDMTKVITMHATCCKGLEAKIIDLRMILDNWKEWKLRLQMTFPNDIAAPISPTSDPNFKLPQACPKSWH